MEVMSAGPATAGPTSATDAGRGWLIPLLVLIVGMFMSVLDTTIVNVAIPTMQRDFGASSDDIEWIVTAYTLALGIVVPLCGWLGDRLGATRVYLVSLVGFSAASALCGMAWDLNSMIVFRILQAIPGGVIPVVSLTMLYTIVPRDQMGSAMGIYGLGIIFGPAIGPTLGGYLVEYVNWRLIFFINAPIGVAGAIAGMLLLPKIGATSKRPMDWWGFLTIAFGLFALLLAFSEGQSWGWTGYRVLMLITAGVLSLALFVVIESEIDEPLLDLRVFKIWPFVNSLLLISILSIGLNSILFYLPLFMQTSQGIQPLRTGLILMPEALSMALLMPVAGKLYDKFGPRWPAVFGLAIACWGGFLLCGINPDMTQGEVILWTVIRAVGNALALMPIMTAGLSAIPPEFTSSGSPVNNIAQRVSGSLGLAAMTVLATSQQHQLMSDRSALVTRAAAVPQLQQAADQGTSGLYGYYLQLQGEVVGQAYSNVFLICAWLSVVGLGLAFMMRKPEPHDEPAQPAPADPPASGATNEGAVVDGEPVTSRTESDTRADATFGAGSEGADPGERTRELTGGPARSGGH
ncbi:MAG TPA: DHA2 family efflux MFS transporter permease subunit [Pseudonocardia sp.]|jgi:EmrB/QacA subfamily drug resistance transporter|nr:DHA2 family efflux MFS transporter permease subunit [Pseudonocardia sp.]